MRRRKPVVLAGQQWLCPTWTPARQEGDQNDPGGANRYIKETHYRPSRLEAPRRPSSSNRGESLGLVLIRACTWSRRRHPSAVLPIVQRHSQLIDLALQFRDARIAYRRR